MVDVDFTTRRKLVAELIGSATLVFVLVSSALLADGMLAASTAISVLFIGLATAGWLFVIVQLWGLITSTLGGLAAGYTWNYLWPRHG